jgi:pseudouridine-5'-phosphate glycosidase
MAAAPWSRRLEVLAGHVLCVSPTAAHTQQEGPVRMSAEVQAAVAAGKPVVALESTIISHGMPFPQNLATARAVEGDVRAAGAVPATVAILDGVPWVGLDDAALERLARAGTLAKKTSRRDLPFVFAQRLTGATTVSATMLLAAAAGVHVFVTGGIGGVHRGASDTWDVSADLAELARTPVMVVCAGAKSILDIPKTLEVLETGGVPVAVFGADDFPAFYTRQSGVRAPWRVDDPADAAAAMLAARGMGGGMLIAVPIPEANAADGAVVERATQAALAEADALHLKGADITPFLLKRVAELTCGDSLTANIALVRHNATVGARIAVEYARLRGASRTHTR